MPADLTRPIEDVVEEIIVAATDTVPALVALTGRATRNVIPWGDYGTAATPVVAFVLQRVEQLTTGAADYRVTLGVAGFAAATDEPTCRALLAAFVAGLQAPGLAAIPAPLGPIDGIAALPVRQSVPGDEDTARADLTITLTLWLA